MAETATKKRTYKSVHFGQQHVATEVGSGEILGAVDPVRCKLFFRPRIQNQVRWVVFFLLLGIVAHNARTTGCTRLVVFSGDALHHELAVVFLDHARDHLGLARAFPTPTVFVLIKQLRKTRTRNATESLITTLQELFCRCSMNTEQMQPLSHCAHTVLMLSRESSYVQIRRTLFTVAPVSILLCRFLYFGFCGMRFSIT